MRFNGLGVAAGARLAGLGVAATLALGVGLVPAVAHAEEASAAAEHVTVTAEVAVVEDVAGEVSDEVASIPAEEPAETDSVTEAASATSQAPVQESGSDVTSDAEPDVEKSEVVAADPAASTVEADSAATDPAASESASSEPAATAVSNGTPAQATAAPASSPEKTEPAEPAAPQQTAVAKVEAASGLVDPQNVYRMYNPNSGEHFYTASESEATHLANVGWFWEGVSYKASKTTGMAVYRLYNPNAGNHFYTTSKVESDNVHAAGWSYEGIAWFTAGDVGLYRLYNRNDGTHVYTSSSAERDKVREAGWSYEGIAWNVTSGYLPVTARWLVSPATGGMERYWVQGDGSIAKNRMVYAGEGAGYNAYATANGAVVRNRHVNFADGVYSADNDGRLTKATWLQGIDIFSGEGDMDVANVDADFVIVKATQGTQYTNPYYIGQANGALAANKLLGFYHYASTNWGGGNPVAEADYFVSRVQTYVGRAILILDWEGGDDGTNNNFGRKDAWYVKTFLDRVYQRTGIRGLVYTSRGAVARRDYSATVNAGYGLWVAQYLYYSGRNQASAYVENPMTTHSSTTWRNGMTGSWSTPVMYQYTSEGHIAGYHSGLDLNKFYGSSDAWKSWASKR